MTRAEAAQHCRTLRGGLGVVLFVLIITTWGVMAWHIYRDHQIDGGPLLPPITAVAGISLVLVWCLERLLGVAAPKK